MQTTRRTILKLVGGAAAGFVLSPIPWKLLDDAAIWTQNWSLIPKLPRGPITSMGTSCTLCTAGCPVRARKVAGNTVSLGRRSSGSFDTPLCLFGLTGHHMAFSPSRLRHIVMRKGGERVFHPAELSDTCREIGDALRHAQEGSAVFLTGRPVSAYVEQIQKLHALSVRTPSHYDGSFFDAQSRILPSGTAHYGLDVSRLKAVLSIDAPLAEGWGLSASFIPQFRDRRAQIHVIHAGSHQSSTAVMADTWLPIAPGSDVSFVRSLCYALLQDGLRSRSIATQEYVRSLSGYRPDLVAQQTRIPASAIEATARMLKEHRPSIVVADDIADPQLQEAVWDLNALLGAFEPDGCLVRRRTTSVFQERPRSAPVNQVDPHSIRLLIIDATVTSAMVPHSVLQNIMTEENALVIRFSPYWDDLSERSDIVISTPAPYESINEVYHRSSSPQASFGLSVPLWDMPATSVSVTEAMMNIAAAAGLTMAGLKTDAALLRERSDRVFRLGRGCVLNGDTGTPTQTTEVSSEESLWELLTNGGIWVDGPTSRTPAPAIALKARSQQEKPTEIPVAQLGHGTSLPVSTPDDGVNAIFGVVSPLLSKVHQESAHGTSVRTVLVHPETAASLGLQSTDTSECTLNDSTREVVVRTSRAVMPGIIVATEGVEGLPDAASTERSAS